MILSGTQAHKVAFSAKFVFLITIFLSFSLLFTSCKKDSEDLTMLGLLALGGGDPTDPPSTTPGITVSPGTTTFSENGGTGNFDVVLNTQPDGDVVIDVTGSDDTELLVSKDGGTTTAHNLSLTFTDTSWNTAQTVTLVGQDDVVVDGNQSVTVTNAFNSGSTADTTGYGSMSPVDVTITVQDDETAGITVTPGTTTFSENGGTGSFDVVLNTQPDGDVVIDVTGGDDTELLVSKDGGTTTASSVSLTFTGASWNTAQTVTLVGQDDNVVDGDQSITITYAINSGSTAGTTGYSSLDPDYVSAIVSDYLSAGDMATYTVNSVDFRMAHVPGKSFFIGNFDNPTATVSNAYQIAETEVTYELWSTVYTWATSNGYTFANAGVQGGGSGGTNQHPVIVINWRSTIVWMNALTEYYNAQNGTSLTPVYYADASYTTPIRDSRDGVYGSSLNSTAGSFDNPYIYAAIAGNTDMANNTADGFRLPTANEWELAARYIDDANGDGDILDAGEYYPGNYASGATADYNDATATGAVAWYISNSSSFTHEVKTKTANALGLYDMSGNVSEWNFDWSSSFKMLRGGSWLNTAEILQVGLSAYNPPYVEHSFMGFRLSRSP